MLLSREVYFGHMKLLAYLLGLLSCSFKTHLSIVSGLKCLFYLLGQTIFFHPKDTRSLLRGKAGLNLSVQIFTRFLGPLLSYEDLLSDLRRSNRRIIKRKYRVGKCGIKKLNKEESPFYHGQVYFQRHEEIRLPSSLEPLHVTRQEEGLQ